MKLSQSDVAKQLHVSKQTVYKWEQGLAPVAAVHAQKTEFESHSLRHFYFKFEVKPRK